jgi:hypothetical protein
MKAAFVLAAGATALLVIRGLSPAPVAADDNLYQYKFPCNPQDACYVTQLAHVGDAFDFDPQGSAGLGDIRVVSEGIFRGYVTVSSTCTWPSGSGLGRYAVIDDMHGRTLRYAHLSSFGVLPDDQRVVQGDLVGIEGNTGYSAQCQPHLHLESIATVPGIDGVATSSITANPTLYTSTNSVVGAINSPGAAIAQRYFDQGAAFTSWATVGWTGDRTGSQQGCGSVPYCRLFIHYHPNPLTGHWGSKQDFRQHPTPQGYEWSSLMVGRWNVNLASWVERGFFAHWYAGYGQGIGLPVADAIPSYPGLCPQGIGCVRYQRFHVGYIWQHQTQGIQSPVLCYDVYPYYPNQNYVSDIDDYFAVAGRFGQMDTLQPYQAWYDSWHDVDGDGAVSIDDLFAVASTFARLCYPP